MAHVILWEFIVAPAHRAAFEARYGPGGDWAKLFARAPGFQRVELLKCGAQDGRYVSIDRWESAASFAAFKRDFAEEYAALDAACEGWTLSEIHLGAFETV